MESPSVVLLSTGLFIPPYAVSNQELVECFNQYVNNYNEENKLQIAAGEIEALKESSSEFIDKASGIKSRYFTVLEGILDPKVMVPNIPERPNEELSLQAEMGVKAARDAMQAANIDASEIDQVILACSNMQRAYPAVSVEIQDALGIKGFAYDMNVACSSATFGLYNGYNSILSGGARAVLVINVEICSAQLNYRDRDSHFIFGDVATAFILQRQDLVKDQHQGFKILGNLLWTQFSNTIRNNFGFLNRCDIQHRDDKDKLFIQQGRKVFKEVCPAVGEHILNHLKSLEIKPEQLKRLWLHQANLSMNQLISKRILGRTPTVEEAPIILDEFANTSSAGCIIALHRFNQDLNPGDLGVISSFGAGYSIGSVVVEKR